MRTAVFTIVSKNYIAMSKTLMTSLKEHQDNWDRYVILVDDYNRTEEAPILENDALYSLIKAIDINIPDAKKMFFRYNILELNTAVKPWAYDYLFNGKGYDRVIYMDPDICVYDRLTEVEDILEDSGSIVLTPHILAPIYDDKKPAELDIMRSGIYNLGFIAVSKGSQTRDFLNWWQNKLEYGCVVDLPSGLFVDQKWMDFVPAIFNKVTILKHRGYNVAYWNLMQREINKRDNQYFVDGEPLIFFHFSGLNPTNIKNFSKHQNRFEITDIGIAKDIVEDYAAKVIENGFKKTCGLAYTYDYFNDNTKISQFIRNFYNQTPHLIEKCGSDPFVKSRLFTSERAFLGDNNEILITPVMNEIWRARPDLQRAYPDFKRSQRYDYANWFVQSSRIEYGLDDVYILPVENSLKKFAKHNLKNTLDHSSRNISRKSQLRQACRPIISKLARKSKPFVKSICREATWEHLKEKYFEIINTPVVLSEQQNNVQTTYDASLHEKGINLIAYIRGDFGVAEAGRANANSIKHTQLPFGIVNFEQDTPHLMKNKSWDDYITNEFKYNVNLFHVNADQTPALEEAFGSEVWEGRYNIGFWVWELPEFPDEWKKHFRRYNEIWTPSRFVVESISEKSPIPVFRVPHSIEVKTDESLSREYFGLPEDKFLFLFMFDVMSIQARKNPEAVIKAFEAAFNRNDPNVGLVIKINNGKQTPDAVKRLQQQFEGRNNVYFIDKVMLKEEVNSLINSVDCFVSLHRSEGFGLGLAESMYMGKPVIGTNWSANTDFMNPKNSCPVDYKLIKVGQDFGPYKAYQQWADPDVEHAAEFMKRLVNDKDYYLNISKQGEKTIKEEFSAEAVSRIIKSRLSSLELV